MNLPGNLPPILLLGSSATQVPLWVGWLQQQAPDGSDIQGLVTDHATAWATLQNAPWPPQRVCLLLTHLVNPQAQAMEARWRQWLAQASHPYRLFYLDLEPHLAQTQARLLRAAGLARLEHRNNHAVWQCHGCSDPDCEQRLFGALAPKPLLNG